MATETSSSSTTFASPSKKERDVTVEALNHLIHGKRHLLVQDIPSAIESLQEAVSLLSACYGELANECGDAYYYYGLALLEMSRRESGVLANGKDGSASEGETDEDSEDEEDDDEEKNSTEEDSKSSAKLDTAKDEKGEGATLIETSDKSEPPVKPQSGSGSNGVAKHKDDSEAKSEDLEDSKKADEGDAKDIPKSNTADAQTNDETSTDTKKSSAPATSSAVAGSSVTTTAATGSSSAPSSSTSSVPAAVAGSSSGSSSDPAQPGTSQGAAKEADEEEDISNLQLAWEVLELAKVIFKRQAEGSPEMQMKLANVYSKLGEVAMESENYDQGVEDLLECLDIQRLVLSADNRNIAETYYQLGLAYSFSLQFDMSIGNFQNAIKIIEQRIASLENVVSGKISAEKSTDDDPIAAAQEEIKELKALVPEIKEKILDTEDLKKNSVKLPEALNQDLELKPTQAGSSSIADPTNSPMKEQKPVTNIGHLVRKKERNPSFQRKPDDVEEAKVDSTKESKRLREENAFSVAMAASTELIVDRKPKSS